MSPSLQQETEKLTRSWDRVDAAQLRDYLVAGVEDPRINLQSIFSRHFLCWNLFGGRFKRLMNEEYRFSGIINALMRLGEKLGHPEDVHSLLYALNHGADNAEGIEIPPEILRAYKELPVEADGQPVPNYVREFLEQLRFSEGKAVMPDTTLETFCTLWKTSLGSVGETHSSRRPVVLEPACGSANDYRCLQAYKFTEHVDYTGFDLCEKNVANARNMFADAKFEVGNVFAIGASDRACDFCFVHDLLEHLSPEGMQAAVDELCRVTRRALCVHFFSMDEIRDHIFRPVEDYHWNKLSMGRMREMFASRGFGGQVFNLATFLCKQTGFGGYHNPNAYTFILERKSDR